jgi:hypothetical protein
MRDVTRLLVAIGIIGVSAVRCDGESSAICDADQLTAALESAGPGDTVRVGACRVEGAFTVPAGVALVGEGPSASTLVSNGRRPVVRVEPGSPGTRLADLAVESDANYGVFIAAGTGSATVERVIVSTTRGVALGAQGTAGLVLSDVELRGPVTRENQLSYGVGPVPDSAPTHGLVLVEVASAELTNVTATGFALFGALIVESTTTWRGGGAPRNMGNGLMVHAGTAHLEDLDFSGTFGDYLLMPAYGAVFAADAVVDTVNLTVSDGANFGLLHDHATVTHQGLKASNNVHAAVWVQNCPSIVMTGTGTEILDNGLGGVVTVDTPEVTLEDATISRTAIVRRTYGETGTRDVGAGIELIRAGRDAGTTLAGVTLRNLNIENNAQVGVMFQLGGGGSTAGLVVEGDVNVTRDAVANPEAYGVVAQGGTEAAGWDDAISRDGETATRDHAPHAALDRVGVLAGDDLPGATSVADTGIISIIDPQPPG